MSASCARHAVRLAATRAFDSTGSKIAIKIAMMPTTAINSTSVKPLAVKRLARRRTGAVVIVMIKVHKGFTPFRRADV